MNNATHRIRLKFIKDIISEQHQPSIGLGFLKYLMKHEGEYIETTRTEDGFLLKEMDTSDCSYRIKDYFFTDIREIKVNVEIPEGGDFWVKNKSTGKEFELEQKGDGYISKIAENVFSVSQINIWLNSGTWTICEAPSGDFYFKGMQGIYKVIGKNNCRYSYVECFGLRSTGNIAISALEENIEDGTWTICPEPKKEMRAWNDDEWKEWFDNDGVYIYNNNPKNRRRATNLIEFLYSWKANNATVDNWFRDRDGNPFTKEIQND